MKYFLLLRKKIGESQWKSTTQGSMEQVLGVLELNLRSEELSEFEWRIQPVSN